MTGHVDCRDWSDTVIIVGVPRSGTTLLRVLLDSHSQIAAAPETPWILGSYGGGVSVLELIRSAVSDKHGPVRNMVGVSKETVLSGARALLRSILGQYRDARGAKILVLKTPDDVRSLEWLPMLFPTARFVHLVRDGRDVAVSTVRVRQQLYSLFEHGPIGFQNALRRWVEWEREIRAKLLEAGQKVMRVRYEDLVTNTGEVLSNVCGFIDLPYEASMLNYWKYHHEYPDWEVGSADVAAKRRISASSVGQWRALLCDAEVSLSVAKYCDALAELGYPAT